MAKQEWISETSLWSRRARSRHLLLGVPLIIAACSSASSDDDPVGAPVVVSAPRSGPQPDFGPPTQLAEAPPPISGGTLAIDNKRGIAVAADPDRDRVYVVDLPTRSVRHTISLAHRSEPGRVALDRSNRAHVLLRNTGELATIDLATGAVELRTACTAPRGITFDAAKNLLHVACMTGDLLTFATTEGGPITRSSLGRDVRDVVLLGNKLMATRFRSASVVPVDANGRAEGDRALGNSNLAWRAIAAPVDPDANAEEEPEAIVVTQEPTQEPVKPEPGGYGGSGSLVDRCSAPVGAVATRLHRMTRTKNIGSLLLPSAVLPVDVATNGRDIAVVAAGNAFTKSLPQLFVVHKTELRGGQENCVDMVQSTVPGQAVSAAFDGADELVVQTREPAALHIMTSDRRRVWKTISLATDTRADTGHAIFHANAGANISCASCHAEGMDDGKTWEFVGMGPRRTPSLLGTTPGTEPFHWSGDMKDLQTLVDHVFVERMGGPKIDGPQVDHLGHYLFTLPAPPKLRNEADVPVRGKELFTQRCGSCHSGPLLTNNQSVDVGTDGVFQVPSLVGIGWRAPFLHTGCAQTLFDRFDPSCGGTKHGDTADLTKDQIADIVAYVETL